METNESVMMFSGSYSSVVLDDLECKIDDVEEGPN